MNKGNRIFLSPPYIGPEERQAVADAFASGYVAPCGPQVDEFERRLAGLASRRYAVAVNGGTAALSLAMACHRVDSSWTVFAPTLTFIASVGPAFHRGAKLVFVDSDDSGLIDLSLLERALSECPSRKKMIVGVDLYGNCCDYGRLEALAKAHDAVLVMDSAEAVGAKSGDRPAGSAGEIAVYSFNGNKIVTTSGGGALLTDNREIAIEADKLARQAREPVLWYEHREVGFNYRLSNLLAAMGLAQLDRLDAILAKRRTIAAHYSASGRKFLPSAPGANCWLTVLLCGSQAERNLLLDRFDEANIEVRPVWKPMHLQPVFAGCQVYGGEVAADLFARGLCLPSGTGLDANDLKRIDEVLQNMV